MAKKKELSFEEALAGLEEIIGNMENGELSLRDLMDNYAQGVKLSKQCMQELEQAEKSMDILIKEENNEAQELELKIEGD
jgi:exodeoxyribonuclease VII small subunit